VDRLRGHGGVKNEKPQSPYIRLLDI
jgi:hypothetical protein